MKTNIRFEKRDLRIIACFLFLLPFLSFAQKDTVKVSFSEETVEKFEKTNILDEYDKAFGGNRVVKSGLRFGMSASPMLGGYAPPSLQYEIKTSINTSLIANVGESLEKNSKFNIGLEGRWYYNMRKKVELNNRKPNITGSYIGIKWQHTPFWVKEFSNEYWGYHNEVMKFNFRESDDFRLMWGKQFGNNLNFGLAIGAKRGRESYINTQKIWVNDLNSKFKYNPYITTYSQIGIGLFFPIKKKVKNEYCEFIGCQYEVNKLLKWNLNNAFYLDKFQQNLQGDVAYEIKLGNSPFSLNSNIRFAINRTSLFNQIGEKDSLVRYGSTEFVRKIPLFSQEKKAYYSYSFEVSEQLRYYVGMNNRVGKGTTANNLNGLYLGLFLNYQLNRNISYNLETYTNKSYYFGGTLGIQSKVSKNSFIDLGWNLGFRKREITFLNFNTNPNDMFGQFYLKLGFAK